MKVNVEYFGIITEITGKQQEVVSGCKSLQEINVFLQQQYPAINLQTYSLAVNNALITGEKFLEPNDTVSVLPPFSGG